MTTAFGFNRRRRASSAMRRVVASSGVWNVTGSQCRATSSNGTKSPPPSRTARGGSQVSTRNPHDAAYRRTSSPTCPAPTTPSVFFGRMPPVALREVMQYGCDPLQYAAGVAACGRCYADLPAPAVVEVDMVESDGRRGDEPHPRTVRAAPRRSACGCGRSARRRRVRRAPLSPCPEDNVSRRRVRGPLRENGMALSMTIFTFHHV